MMMMLRYSNIARAYRVSDARRPRLTSARNGQGLPGFGRSRLKTLVQSESGNVECGDNDWKRKGVGGSDGEEEGWSVECAGDPVEGEQGERVRWILQVVLQWCR